MKKILLLGLFALIIGFYGCKKDDDKDTSGIHLIKYYNLSTSSIPYIITYADSNEAITTDTIAGNFEKSFYQKSGKYVFIQITYSASNYHFIDCKILIDGISAANKNGSFFSLKDFSIGAIIP